MEKTYFLSLLPIVISILTLWVNFIYGSNKNKTGIIDCLSKELSNKRPNPYVIQLCISRIHRSRPISHRILNKILYYNNAMEIIQLVSTGRKILDILKLSEEGKDIVVGYSDAYSSVGSRWSSSIICFFAMVFCYLLSVYTMIDAMMIMGGMAMRDNEFFIFLGAVIPKLLALLFFMIMTFIFSWQLLIIVSAKKRISKIQKLINDGVSLYHCRSSRVKSSLN